MVLEAYRSPSGYNILVTVASWLLLAGFVIFPGTYSSLQESDLLYSTETGRAVSRVIQNVPLLVIAIACCVLGAFGVGVLWWLRRNNYIWLMQKIFM